MPTKTYKERLITSDEMKALALTDSRFANSFNGFATLTDGQILKFPKVIERTWDEFGPTKQRYYSVVTMDGTEVAFSQFTKNDHTGLPVNPKFGGLGYDAICALLSDKTVIVQKTIKNMANFDRNKAGETVRVTALDRLYSPKAVNYFIVDGLQPALLAE